MELLPPEPKDVDLAISVGPYIKVRPDGYSGIERDAADWALAAANMGFKVHVLASADSKISDEHENISLYPIVPAELRSLNLTDVQRREAESHAAFQTARYIDKLGSVQRQLVLDCRWENSTLLYRMVSKRQLRRYPHIINFSCSPNASQILMTRPGYESGRRWNALSGAHKRSLDAFGELDWNGHRFCVDVIPYGVSFDHESAVMSNETLLQYGGPLRTPILERLRSEGKEYLLMLASKNQAKGQSSAIALFQKAKKKGLKNTVLLIGGAVDAQPASVIYNKEKIQPHVNGVDVIDIGEADEATKWELMRFAVATVFCSSMEDPDYIEAYGRVLAESAGMGTPVLGFRSDTFRELILEGVTGLGFDTIEEGVEQLSRIRSLGRAACAELARREMGFDRYVKQMSKLVLYLAHGALIDQNHGLGLWERPRYAPDDSYKERMKRVPDNDRYTRIARSLIHTASVWYGQLMPAEAIPSKRVRIGPDGADLTLPEEVQARLRKCQTIDCEEHPLPGFAYNPRRPAVHTSQPANLQRPFQSGW